MLVVMRGLSEFHRPFYRRDVFPEGIVHRLWLGWWLVKLMVKAGGRS